MKEINESKFSCISYIQNHLSDIDTPFSEVSLLGDEKFQGS